MKSQIKNIVAWITPFIVFLSFCLMIFSVVIILNQQKQIKALNSKIDYISHNVGEVDLDEVNSKIDALDSKLDDVQSSLSSDIEDVSSTVRLYGH